MDTAHDKKWVELFQKAIPNLRRIEILQEIDVGYNSIVYLVSIDENRYAVKIYRERFNGTNVCKIEKAHIQKARKSIPDAVPYVLFSSRYKENEFHREILVMQNAEGISLNSKVLDEPVFRELIKVLTRLHSTRLDNQKAGNEIQRIDACRDTILQFLKADEVIPSSKASQHFAALKNYCLEKNIFNFPKTIVHGDLWWDNILVDDGKIRLVDWLESSEQDYCQDLAHLQIGVLNEFFDTPKSHSFFKTIVKVYQDEFDDDTIFERIRCYLPLLYLEEAFYLLFKFFPWELKYQENAENFKKRFIDYFEKSEFYFKWNF